MNFDAAMREAIELAQRGRGRVEPNPRVGALALHAGEVIGRGWHAAFGAAHAEVQALADASRHAAGLRPDTIVVTLEPCSTELGVGGKRTPPCTRALLESGVRRVIVGATDPDPRHRGRGLDHLRAAGIDVISGVLETECAALLRAFTRGLALERPWIIAKWAMTLDGKIASASGDSRWISSEVSRARVHELRASVDAVVVGLRTAARDDPQLTVRHTAGRNPVRIVVDPRAELSLESRLVCELDAAPTWVLVAPAATTERRAALAARGVVVIEGAAGERADRLDLAASFRLLRERSLRRVLVEGGGSLLGALWRARCVDQVFVHIAPRVVGGSTAPTPFDGEGFARIADGVELTEHWFDASGVDLEYGGIVGD